MASQNIHKVMSRAERRSLKVSVNWSDPIPAPLKAGQEVGYIQLSYADGEDRIPLLAAEDVAELGFFDRITEAFKYLIFGSPFDAAGNAS